MHNHNYTSSHHVTCFECFLRFVLFFVWKKSQGCRSWALLPTNWALFWWCGAWPVAWPESSGAHWPTNLTGWDGMELWFLRPGCHMFFKVIQYSQYLYQVSLEFCLALQEKHLRFVVIQSKTCREIEIQQWYLHQWQQIMTWLAGRGTTWHKSLDSISFVIVLIHPFWDILDDAWLPTS